MRDNIQNLAVLDLCDAAAEADVDRVETLLASGVDPNARFDDVPSPLFGVADDWASIEKSTHPPVPYDDDTVLPALRRAAHDLQSRDRSAVTRIMTALLQHGADPYALFRQSIHVYRIVPAFPGETKDPGADDEETDLLITRNCEDQIQQCDLKLERRRQLAQEAPAADEDEEYESDWEIDDVDVALSWEPEFPRKFGAYSIIHSLLEDGMMVKPVLDFLGDNLDVERRDPQGRTLFLAACRSKLGLDASIEGRYNGLKQHSRFGDLRGLRENPYPQPDNPWRQCEQGDTTTCTGPTLLEFFVSRGANLFAVDNYGKNALHQLFKDSSYHFGCHPTISDIALKYLVTNCPSLINQPDHAGFYPLHLAIRRMGAYLLVDPDFEPEAIFELETPVYNLLASGADPLVRDARGNTILHYLAACRLSNDDRRGDKQRELLRVFLDRGVDATARNIDGASALEIFVTTKDNSYKNSWSGRPEPPNLDRYDAIGKEVFGAFEHAECTLTETNPAGQTLLHLVAGRDSARAYPWFKSLQAKGLDPMAKDKEGRTPMDVAKENDSLNWRMTEPSS